jgi:hypothetical protein
MLFNGCISTGILYLPLKRLTKSYGGWLGIKPVVKLARVTIDYQNSADKMWNLDITKQMQSFHMNLKRN